MSKRKVDDVCAEEQEAARVLHDESRDETDDRVATRAGFDESVLPDAVALGLAADEIVIG